MKQVFLLLAALIAGCGATETGRIVPRAPVTISGEAHLGWEWSYIQPDGDSEKYGLLATPDFKQRLDALYPDRPSYLDKSTRVTVEGYFAERGPYEPPSGSRYLFHVTRVEDMRLPEWEK